MSSLHPNAFTLTPHHLQSLPSTTDPGSVYPFSEINSWFAEDIFLGFRQQQAPKTGPGRRPTSRARSDDDSLADVSNQSAPSLKRPRTTRKQSRSKSSKKADDGKLQITTQTWVDRVITLTAIPATWDVPRDGAAYVLDLSAVGAIPLDGDDVEYRIDSLIRADVRRDSHLPSATYPPLTCSILQSQESWGTGTAPAGSCQDIWQLSDDGEPVQCRRVVLNCNGTKVCSKFDIHHLEGYQRFESDDTVTKVIFEAYRRQRIQEQTSSALKTVLYVEVSFRLLNPVEPN